MSFAVDFKSLFSIPTVDFQVSSPFRSSPICRERERERKKKRERERVVNDLSVLRSHRGQKMRINHLGKQRVRALNLNSDLELQRTPRFASCPFLTAPKFSCSIGSTTTVAAKRCRMHSCSSVDHISQHSLLGHVVRVRGRRSLGEGMT